MSLIWTGTDKDARREASMAKSPKRCPFCTSKKVEVVNALVEDAEGEQVVCNNCGAAGPLRKTEAAAVEGWNAA